METEGWSRDQHCQPEGLGCKSQ